MTLDAWEPEVLRVMTKLGNTIANGILEYVVPTGMVKPVANSSRCVRVCVCVCFGVVVSLSKKLYSHCSSLPSC